MKKFVAALFLFTVSFANAQSVSNYKYVIVPNTFDDFQKEDYQLNTYLKTLLRKKKYEIVVEGSKDIPSDLQQNECLATKANILDVKSSFQNKLNVVFTDCNNNVLLELDGSSKIKDFKKGYQDALNVAMNKLPLQNANDIVTSTLPIKKSNNKANIYTVEGEVNGEVKIPVDSNKRSLEKYELESNGKKYELVELSPSKAQLVNLETQIIIANLYVSGKEKVVHVEVFTPNGSYNTLGYANGKNLIIEYKNGNESWIKTEYFSK